jgi:serine/threonine protein kinase
VWKRLVHPNIVPLLGVTTAPYQSVSEWVYGEELLQYVDAHPSADRLGLVSGIANGLSYLHSHNVLHGDLKGVRKILNHLPDQLTRTLVEHPCG